jgi:spermidine synthase
MEPVTFSESGGIRYLHFGTDLIQGAMRMRDPDEIYLEYNQQMMAWLLFLETMPGMKVAQLGLGNRRPD